GGGRGGGCAWGGSSRAKRPRSLTKPAPWGKRRTSLRRRWRAPAGPGATSRAVTTPRFDALGPEAALDAAEAAGLRPSGHCAVLRALENRVYDVRLEDGAHVVVKFYRPWRWSLAALEDEHRFMR